MILVRSLILFFPIFSFLIGTPSFAHSSLFTNKFKPNSLNHANKTLTVKNPTDFSGFWRVTSKNCILFKENDTLQIEQNEKFLRVSLNGDSEPATFSFGKLYVEGEEDQYYDQRNVFFAFWNEDGKTFYLNNFDIAVNKIENNTILKSIAWSMQNDQIHVRYKEQSYSPDFNKKASPPFECVLSRQ